MLDVVAGAVELVRNGDLRDIPPDLVAPAGAYGAALSSGYNSRPITPEVLVDGDRWALVRQRLDLADAASLPMPEWLR